MFSHRHTRTDTDGCKQKKQKIFWPQTHADDSADDLSALRVSCPSGKRASTVLYALCLVPFSKTRTKKEKSYFSRRHTQTHADDSADDLSALRVLCPTGKGQVLAKKIVMLATDPHSPRLRIYSI